MGNVQKEVQVKLTKGLLDLIILQFLNSQPMHGYQVITRIRRDFGVYFGPSTIYPLMGQLEKKKYIKSEWNMEFERPRKVYNLTNDGQMMLKFTENSLNLLRQRIGPNESFKAEHETAMMTMGRSPNRLTNPILTR